MNDMINDIEFGESLSIAQVGELYVQLLTSIADEKAINLDLSQIERVDTAAIQLLYSFQRDAVAQGLVIIWSNPSKVFCDAVDILDVPAFYRER
ncbi:STAS domain-containing protein [Methylophaga thiooxydans]|uniref:STAS domain-containing protein n=1 Tax=Methylophaga thiooxydans TaxID=392484 RepID=UPI002355BF2C|nr:STAS domain-containing protein [Methylophaga thiooxydans]